MSLKRKRVSYTAQFKLKVIAKVEEVGNREAGKLFQVDESNARLWKKNKESLGKGNQRRRSDRHGVAKWPVLEENLLRWITAQRDADLPVSTVNIRMKSVAMAQEMGLKNFQGGPTWCYRFMRRKNLRMRTRTAVGQRLPDDWESKKEDFLKFTKETIVKGKYLPNQVINMDETPLCFDCPPNRTVDVCGTNTVSIKTTGNEKTSFTVVLACTSDGQKLDPMIIFKRKTLPKENFPKGVIIEANENGWMKEQVMLNWLNTVWRKRKGAFFQPKGVLIMDSMTTHICEPVKTACKAVMAELCIIPGGVTKMLQPLDVAVNKSFKSKVRKLWEKWMSEGYHTFTKTGKMRRATYADVAAWVKTAWDDISSSTIVNAFRKSGISDIDQNESDSCDEDSDPDDPGVLTEELMQMFHSDSEESEFEGFP